MTDVQVKQLKIRTGVVRRLVKEKQAYEKEAVDLEQKVEKMKTDGKDEYDIRKQTEVLQESKAMIPDTLKRLKTAYAELEQLIQTSAELHESEEYVAAQNVMESAKAVLA
ncbi:hypothetical protein ScPMuIL_018217 [Solemya velum]